MDLEDCFNKGLVKKTEVNIGLIKSLKEMSNIKELAVKSAVKSDVFEKNQISAFVPLAYDPLQEILNAIYISRGHKVLSHVCLAELARTLIDDFNYEGFDRLRWIRNSISYYGMKIEPGQGKEIINKIFRMKNNLLKYLDDFINNQS